MSEFNATPAVRTPRYPRRIVVCVAALAGAGIFAAAGYGGYKLTRPVTPVVTIGCYESDSLDANTAVLTRGVDAPVATCSAKYASAFPGSPKPSSFAACVLPSGSIGVFPGDTAGDTCKSLGLAEAP